MEAPHLLPTTASLEVLAQGGTFVGRAWVPASRNLGAPGGPRIVAVRQEGIFDLSHVAGTMSDLLDDNDPVAVASSVSQRRLGSTEEALEEANYWRRDPGKLHFLSPVDLQAVKGAGVTFAKSAIRRTLPRLTDSATADEVLAEVEALVGDLDALLPGSPKASQVKEIVQARGLWTPYLEVAFGREPEVFTKAFPLGAVGTGQRVGIRQRSMASQPEPEIVLLLSRDERIVGVSLGNDIDLRDFEDRSPYLVAQYKDSHGAAAVGPWIRLFDADFGVSELMGSFLTERIRGLDGFEIAGHADQTEFSRPLDKLVKEVGGGTHYFPDGLALFIGCNYVPDVPRGASDGGFTLRTGDLIEIEHPHIGALVNWVGTSEELPPPEFSIRDVMRWYTVQGHL